MSSMSIVAMDSSFKAVYMVHWNKNDERDWLIKGSTPYKELELIVKSKLLLKDIARLSPAEQTSSLESFHKVILFFAPKSVHFPFTTMAAREQLAGLHFNENSARAQALTQTGKHMWGVSFPKARRGEPVIKAVKVTPTFVDVQELMGEVVELRNTYPTSKKAEALRSNRQVPPPIASAFVKPNKLILVGVQRSRSRFNK
ncbi:hypothetical protein CgunFtcFv8_007820 [Champsocephalus gunnari]|uniref:Uncharacterized protein n=1 Tax=Champsocephalus gunnari TaxID=52237 RepID=A0AAN8D160_CHAGU|nr:hypothetical protein CgunFtcFv8_007820 [Champsocephalus gunnari]